MGDKKLPTVVFGEVLRALRVKQGITQDQLAERVETERSHISAIERAEKGPALATIFSLAEGLGMSASELIGQVEKELNSRRIVS
jgi:transcriptional regulator with XRE-family HTH domain